MKRYEILSVIPDVFDSYMNASILGRAQKSGILSFSSHNLRNWTHDKHHKVDDEPFGGGQGMLMKPAPIFEALEDISSQGTAPHVVFFSPTGATFTQQKAQELTQYDRIVFVCGRYEGMDERVYQLADDIISVGDFVLTGGELPALLVIDAVARLVPGVLGNSTSFEDESFCNDGLLEYEQYTRPACYRDMCVPDVLLSGHHENIAKWRRLNAIKRTAHFRPDLLDRVDLTDSERRFAQAQLNDSSHSSDEL